MKAETGKRVLLLMSAETYRATDFLAAADALGVDVVVGLDARDPVEAIAPERLLALDFADSERAAEEIVAAAAQRPLDAVVPVDDVATVLAARAATALGLPTNPVEAAVASLDKAVLREIMASAGLRSPWFETLPVDADAAEAAARVPYPCVLKPLFLSASRGVIRADDPEEFVAAFARIGRLLQQPDVRARGSALAERVLVESFMPGQEVALEGLVRDGEFHLLAFFDKPDALDGPFFEETLFITPSRHPAEVQAAAVEVARQGARALGLRTGPVHAELRLDGGEPYLLELATRSIGGHCSRTLRFGTGWSLEQVILRQALGTDAGEAERERRAAGVMMIPIPAAGVLHGVTGLDAARAVPGIADVEITIPRTQPVVPWPEGHRYLGFIFARGETPAGVEDALRAAHRHLRFDIRSAEEEAARGA